MILRCTQRVRAILGPVSLVHSPPDDNDWYLHLLWMERRKCLLLIHAGTLFSAFVPDVRKAELLTIGPYVVNLVEEELRSEGLPLDILGRLDPDVQFAKTASRSILGFMNDMALHCQYEVEDAGGLSHLDRRRLEPSTSTDPPQPRRHLRVVHGPCGGAARFGAPVTDLDPVLWRGFSHEGYGVAACV